MSGHLLDQTLELLMSDPEDTEGNAELMTLYYEFRRRRRRMRAILASAFQNPRGIEPVSFRGCYFLADGEGPGERAFSAGLLRGPRGRILADHGAATWAEGARRADRRDYRLAFLVGGVGGMLLLLGWVLDHRTDGPGVDRPLVPGHRVGRFDPASPQVVGMWYRCRGREPRGGHSWEKFSQTRRPMAITTPLGEDALLLERSRAVKPSRSRSASSSNCWPRPGPKSPSTGSWASR